MASGKLQAAGAFQAAIAFHQAGRLGDALLGFEEALRLQPDNVQAMVLLAVVLLQMGRAQEASCHITRALQFDPQNLAAHVTLGQVQSHMNLPEAAIESFDQALRINPRLATAHYSRGVELHRIGRRESALDSLDRAIDLDPNNASAHYARGVALNDLKRHHEAIASFDKAISIQPRYTDALVNRGVALAMVGRLDEALANYDAAIASDRHCALAFSNRGHVLAQLQRLDEAVASGEQAIALKPGDADAYVNRGVALSYLKQWNPALDSYDRAIELRPDHVRAHVNKAIALLSSGDLERGFAEYEWRLREYEDNLPDYRSFAQPQWRGTESLAGKSILLYSEAGLGDTIQFCRYATLVADLGAKVLLQVQPPLIPLLRTLDARVQVVALGSRLPDFDYCCPLMSLPLALKTTMAGIPARIPYIRAGREKFSHWSAVLGEHRRRRIGLVWSGGFRPDQPHLWPTDRRRNIPLRLLASLRHPDLEFYSLQKGRPAEDELAQLAAAHWEGPELIDHTSLLRDFSDTAALIENLDLVISVDTSTAHLAGALGKPIWLLNRFDSCWRWLSGRTDSPWYPTLKLYSQPRPGEWQDVIERVRTDLLRQELAP